MSDQQKPSGDQQTPSDEQQKSTEEQVEKIEAIDSYDSLGYQGAGREEHSGENTPDEHEELGDELADNEPHERP
jgi:NTP pyrophosphatase (non-canonical NTP hydrolase)